MMRDLYVCFRYAHTNQFFEAIYRSDTKCVRTDIILAIGRYLLMVNHDKGIDADSIKITGIEEMDRGMSEKFCGFNQPLVNGLNVIPRMNLTITETYSQIK